MSPRWKVTISAAAGDVGPVRRVHYGPADDWMPARFAAELEYVDRPLLVGIEATFDGVSRVRASVVSVRRTDDASISPEDMTLLQLGAAMGSVVWSATNDGRGVAYQGGRRGAGPPTDAELLTLARMYWFHFVSWGKPRQAVMSAFELPRSTANHWIRKARERYSLPGAHAADEEA